MEAWYPWVPRPKTVPGSPREGPPAGGPHPAYDYLIDTVDVRKWTAGLGYDYQRKRWTLTVRNGGKVLAQGDSRARAPRCFSEVASACRSMLEEDGRLTE